MENKEAVPWNPSFEALSRAAGSSVVFAVRQQQQRRLHVCSVFPPSHGSLCLIAHLFTTQQQIKVFFDCFSFPLMATF